MWSKRQLRERDPRETKANFQIEKQIEEEKKQSRAEEEEGRERERDWASQH